MKDFAIRSIFDLVGKDIETKKPIIYFESMKASSVGLKNSTVYATGGKGNAKLVGFSGDKDVKIDAEEALLSTKSLGLFMGRLPKKYKKIVHKKQDFEIQPDSTDPTKSAPITLKFKPIVDEKHPMFVFLAEKDGKNIQKELTKAKTTGTPATEEYDLKVENLPTASTIKFGDSIKPYDVVIVDYYYETLNETNEIRVTTTDFPKNMYWEGDALVRTQGDDLDHAARIVIPNGKLITDGFNLDMKPTGDPSTFKFSIECLKPLRGKDLIVIDIDEDTEEKEEE